MLIEAFFIYKSIKLKTRVTLLFFCFSVVLFAQKKVDKTWFAKDLKSVVIAANNVFKIKVSNSISNSITLKVNIEGEYAEQLAITDSIKNKTLFLSSAFQPLFKTDNDKLSVHKVLSVEFEIGLPNYISLDIKSNIASVDLTGNYPSVFIETQQGNCSLKHFLGNATINTIDGNIDITTNNATIEAFTKTGQANIHQFKYGQYQIYCQSINGAITVKKIEK